jgi:large subunit ribosomal protein L21
MYAMVEDRGKQYKMVPGETVVIDLLDGESGAEIRFDKVLVVRTDAGMKTGEPYVSGVSVVTELVDHFRGVKIVIGKYKRRKNYNRKNGHRQPYTRVRVKEIVA